MLKPSLKTKDTAVLRLLLIIILSLIIASCANFSPTTSKPTVARTWAERQQLLSQLNQFQLSGKIAFKTTQDAGSATLNWKENRGQYRVALFGPLGSNGVTITGQKGNVILQTANGKKSRAATPEALLSHELGYQLPVSLLKYWVRGLPVSGLAKQASFDAYHRLNQLQQAGWQVKFLSYTNVGSLDLPNKISFTSATLTLKIVIYDWQLQ